MTDQIKRDGVWTKDGLKSDFRIVRQHPNCAGFLVVETVTGQYYAHESELEWDHEPDETH